MNHISYLKRVRLAHWLLLVLAVTVTALGFLLGGIAALAFAIFVPWRFHRCLHCNGEIETLMKLEKETVCPHCGFYLKDGTEPEEMRIERERAEEEARAKAEAEAAEKAAAEAAAAEAGEAEAAPAEPGAEPEPGAEAAPATEAAPAAEPAPAPEPEPEPAAAAAQ